MDTIPVVMIHYRKWINDKIIPDNLLEFRSEVNLLIHNNLLAFLS